MFENKCVYCAFQFYFICENLYNDGMTDINDKRFIW